MIQIRPVSVKMANAVEAALDEADARAEESPYRMTHEEVFGSIRKRINDAQSL